MNNTNILNTIEETERLIDRQIRAIKDLETQLRDASYSLWLVKNSFKKGTLEPRETLSFRKIDGRVSK